MRTSLGKVRGRGAAKTGTEHWWMQRVTAIANVPLTIFLVGFLVLHGGSEWEIVIAAIRHPFVAVLLMLSVISMLWHMRLGLQVVIEDYVHGEGAKLALLIANTFFALFMGALSLYAILKMSFA